MRELKGACIFGQSGGPTSVINASAYGVIHTALQDYPDVTTYSTGTEPNRRTVVAYAPGEHR